MTAALWEPCAKPANLRRVGLLVAAGITLILSACAPLPRSAAVPADLEGQVAVLGMTGIRYWGDGDSTGLAQAGMQSLARQQA